LILLRRITIEELGARSQNSGGRLVTLDAFDVCLQETADFFEACPEIRRIDILKVSSEDELKRLSSSEP
jgi:hypothetical protein